MGDWGVCCRECDDGGSGGPGGGGGQGVLEGCDGMGDGDK
jgi:hypothetical protein